jgi:hypothetical protein
MLINNVIGKLPKVNFIPVFRVKQRIYSDIKRKSNEYIVTFIISLAVSRAITN